MCHIVMTRLSSIPPKEAQRVLNTIPANHSLPPFWLRVDPGVPVSRSAMETMRAWSPIGIFTLRNMLRNTP